MLTLIKLGGPLYATPKRSRAPSHFVHLSLIVPDFHALNRAAAQHLMGTLAQLIHILTPDELASHELAGSAEAEKSVGEHARSRRASPRRQRTLLSFIPISFGD